MANILSGSFDELAQPRHSTQQRQRDGSAAAGAARKGRNKTQVGKVEQTHAGDISCHRQTFGRRPAERKWHAGKLTHTYNIH